MGPRIYSENPEFTALLERTDPEHPVAQRYALYESACDPLPPYAYADPANDVLRPVTVITVTADDIVAAQDDQRVNPGRWPSPHARPTLAITGSVPVIRS